MVSFLPQPSQQRTTAADCNLSHMSHNHPSRSSTEACVVIPHGSCELTVTSLWCDFTRAGHHTASLPPQLGPTGLQLVHTGAFHEKTASHFRQNHRAPLPEGEGSIYKLSKCPCTNAYQIYKAEPTQQLAATKTQAFSLPVPKLQFRERGESDKSPAGFTNGNGSQKNPLPAQHWNKVV